LSTTESADSTHSRSWREIAKEAATERDPSKELELAQELIRALDAESMHHMERANADDKAEKKAA